MQLDRFSCVWPLTVTVAAQLYSFDSSGQNIAINKEFFTSTSQAHLPATPFPTLLDPNINDENDPLKNDRADRAEGIFFSSFLEPSRNVLEADNFEAVARETFVLSEFGAAELVSDFIEPCDWGFSGVDAPNVNNPDNLRPLDLPFPTLLNI